MALTAFNRESARRIAKAVRWVERQDVRPGRPPASQVQFGPGSEIRLARIGADIAAGATGTAKLLQGLPGSETASTHADDVITVANHTGAPLAEDTDCWVTQPGIQADRSAETGDQVWYVMPYATSPLAYGRMTVDNDQVMAADAITQIALTADTADGITLDGANNRYELLAHGRYEAKIVLTVQATGQHASGGFQPWSSFGVVVDLDAVGKDSTTATCFCTSNISNYLFRQSVALFSQFTFAGGNGYVTFDFDNAVDEFPESVKILSGVTMVHRVG